MHKSGAAGQRLHQVGHDGLFEQHRHGPGHVQVFGGDGFHRPPHIAAAFFAGADDDAAHARAQVRQVGAHCQRRHDLRGHGDVKARFARRAVVCRALAQGDVAQRRVAHVHHAPPLHGIGVNVQAEHAAPVLDR